MAKVDYNVFRVLGDVSHTLSKLILIWAIHTNRSAEGVSLISQALYALVFVVRYLDLFWTPPSFSYWNFGLKILYIATTFYTLFLMLRVYARTREREKAWRLGAYSLLGAVVAAPVVTLVYEGKLGWRVFEILYTFTLILESFCILPQLLLLRQTTVPTVIDSFYLVTLGSYRFFYILNWLLRGIKERGDLEPIFPVSVTFGIIQTALYFDFAWVYWSRQRVKLRGGGVVDTDDFRRGWLVSKIIGRRSIDEDAGEAEERRGLARQEEGTSRHDQRWGPRGISVSADEGVEQSRHGDSGKSQLADPDAFEDLEDDEEEGTDTRKHDAAESGHGSGVSAGEEWRDER